MKFDISEAKKGLLLLSGGGLKGAFEAGAMVYIASRWEEFNFDTVVGNSVGAINSIPLSISGKDGVPLLVEIYLQLHRSSDLYENSLPYDDRLEKVKVLTDYLDAIGMHIARTPSSGGSSDFGLLFSLANALEDIQEPLEASITTGLKAIGSNSAKSKVLHRIIDVAEEAVLIRYFFELDPLANLIERTVNLEDVGETLDLRLGLVNLDDGLNYYMDEQGGVYQNSADRAQATGIDRAWPSQRTARLLKGILASSAMPGLFPPQEFGGRAVYVDGGIHGTLPSRAAEDLGHEIIVGINASVPEVGEGDYHDATFLDVARRGSEIASAEASREKLDPLGGWCDEKRRLIVMPSIRVQGTYEVDAPKARINMDHGYMPAHDLYHDAVGTWEDADAGVEHWGIVWGEYLIHLRLDVLNLERSLYRLGHSGFYVANQFVLDRIRELKREIARTVEQRVFAFGEESVPVSITRANGDPLLIEDWWMNWTGLHPRVPPIPEVALGSLNMRSGDWSQCRRYPNLRATHSTADRPELMPTLTRS